MNKDKNRRLLFHVLGGLIFLSLPVFFSPDFSTSLFFLHVPPFQRDFLTYALLLVFFYFNYFLLIPNYYFKKKYALFFLFLAISFVAVVLLPGIIIPEQEHRQPEHHFEHHEHHDGFFFFYINNVLFKFLVVGIGSLLLSISYRLKQAEEEKLNAQLAFLKAQINPHFLFNTLNSIYSLALQKSDSTAEAVVKLSGMMRYVTTEANSDFVSLGKEINYISSYIDLQKIRLGNTADVQYSVEGRVLGKTIAPLILISFIENAFKHGVNPEEESHIQITVKVADSELHMMVCNNKVTHVLDEEISQGHGIDNVKQRLQLLYPGKHDLTITDTVDKYCATLTLNLV